jgi:DNA ligase-1
VPQRRLESHAALSAWMRQVVRAGGEGLMLHRGDAPYRSGRSDDLLKLKPHDDAEARVVAHLPGRGRHAGRTGALLVESPSGQRFRIGSGFSDADRNQPPPIGSWITYRFRGTYAGGLPRFASYLRVREDFTPPKWKRPAKPACGGCAASGEHAAYLGSSTLSTTWITPLDW